MIKNNTANADTARRSELRNFGFILAAGIVVLFGIFFPLLRQGAIRWLSWPWLAALILMVISLIAPMALEPLNRAWLFLGSILGYINTRIILGFIFLFIFTPCAFILKLLGKDLMQRKMKLRADSYRVDSSQPNTDNLTRPY